VTAKLCLRCDWSGDAVAEVCPRCGAGLFASGPAKSDPAAERPGRVHALTERLTERSRASALVVALLVVFAIAAVVFVQRHTPSVATTAPVSTGRQGFLFWSAAEGDGVRMWIWDLNANTAVPGPLLDGVPEELVSGYELHGGWIGITTPTSTGERASVLRYLEPGDRPVTVATGDRISWAAESSSVSVLRWQPIGGCAQIAVSTWFVTLRRSVDRFDGVRCGKPVAFARDRNLPYLTIERDGVPTTLRVGAGYTERMFVGYGLVGVSADGDLLVRRPGGGLELAYLSPYGSSPVPIGGRGGALEPIRLLGWSANGSRAYVLGTNGVARGVFQVTVGPLPRPRPPKLLLATSASDVQATPTVYGDVYVSTEGAISLIHGGQATSVELPPGAPPPLGAILWMATLPYSSTEG